MNAPAVQPAYPTSHARVKESVMIDQPRHRSYRDAVAARLAAQEAVTELARSRAAGPDPATGLPAVEVSEEEHRAVGELLAQEIADAAEPQWVTGPDGRDDIHATVTLTDHDRSKVTQGTGQRMFTAEQAAARMAEVGHSRADAETMVSEYLAATGRWRAFAGPLIDDHDLAEIERSYEWVDHYRGETLAQARERAAGYAQGWTRTAPHVDRGHSPGYAAHVDRQVRTWTERAAGTPARADGIYDEDPDPWAVEQDAEDWERAGVDTDPMPDPWANASTPDLPAETDGGPDREAAERPAEHEGPDRCDLDSDLDAVAAEQRVAAVRDAVNQARTAPTRTSRHTEGTTEQDRRAQLAAWAHADTTDTHNDGAGHEMEQQR